jgi:ABC-type Fe3+-hydroxamate transport system substrate-binding protein
MTDLRIVSLCPSLTETLVEIGITPVGVTRYCIRPREALRKVSKVGGTKNPDLDRIRILAPDLVVANAEENRPEHVAALRKDFAVHVSLPRTVAEVPGVVRELGVAAGRAAAAKGLAAEIEEAIAAPPPPAFRYAYFIWKDPWMTVSGDTYVSDLFRYAGGVNVFGEENARYPEVTPARVRAAAPDVLFFPSEPFPFSEGHRTAIETAFGRSTRIEFVDGDDCCWHGARTREGLRLMGQIAARFRA